MRCPFATVRHLGMRGARKDTARWAIMRAGRPHFGLDPGSSNFDDDASSIGAVGFADPSIGRATPEI